MIADVRQQAGGYIAARPANGGGPIVQATVSDPDLLKRISAGDKSAMRALYLRYSVRIFRFALRLVRNKAMADDLVSDVFFDVWRMSGDFEERSQVLTWLLAITRNKAYALLRRRSTNVLDEDVTLSIEDTADGPEAALQRYEAYEIMRKCVAQLSPAHREIINLVYYHDKRVGEVAGIVGIAEGTVKTRIFYARRQLAGLLNTHGITASAL